MTEPTAPTIPDTAPQDVKDFFDCRGNTLAWQPGEVSWLGLPVTPNVTFSAGATAGSVTINVSLAGGLVNFTLPASVNAAGELVVDTSSVPDLSDWGLGGRADIDAAIKRINDWFKHNGKKLKPARLRDGTVTLEKEPIVAVPVTTPAIVPVRPTPPATPPPATPPTTPSTGGGGCSLLFVMMLLLLVGVIAVGGYVGFVYFGGPSPTQVAVASPTASPTSSASPSASPSASASAGQSPTATPAASATPSASPSPGSSSSASPPIGSFTAVCVRVVHEQVGQFVSYLDWFVWWTDFNVEYFEVTVIGANNGESQRLEFESRSQAYEGLLGLHQAGDKRIVSVIAHMSDGSEINLTQDLIDEFGSDEFTVRFPQEDEFGDCPPD